MRRQVHTTASSGRCLNYNDLSLGLLQRPWKLLFFFFEVVLQASRKTKLTGPGVANFLSLSVIFWIVWPLPLSSAKKGSQAFEPTSKEKLGCFQEWEGTVIELRAVLVLQIIFHSISSSHKCIQQTLVLNQKLYSLVWGSSLFSFLYKPCIEKPKWKESCRHRNSCKAPETMKDSQLGFKLFSP